MHFKEMKFYIAGPMTGLPKFNFPSFDEAKEYLISLGVPKDNIISPADLDRERDFDPTKVNMTQEMMDEIIEDDTKAVNNVDALYMLEGWEKSLGARTEHQLACWGNKKIFYQNSL